MLSGKFLKHGNTEIRRVEIDYTETNIADLLIQNHTKVNGVVSDISKIQ